MESCFSFAVDCGTFWTAFGALATAAATIVALGGSILALTAPERQRSAERSSLSSQALSVARSSMELFHEFEQAVDHFDEPVQMRTYRERAGKLITTLRAMIGNPIADRYTRELVSITLSLVERITRVIEPSRTQEKEIWLGQTATSRADVHEAGFLIAMIEAQMVIVEASK